MAASNAERVLIDPLVAGLMEASMKATAAAADDVIGHLTFRADRAEAQLELIRERVNALLDGPWMPMPDAIRHALWPSDGAIRALLAEKESN